MTLAVPLRAEVVAYGVYAQSYIYNADNTVGWNACYLPAIQTPNTVCTSNGFSQQGNLGGPPYQGSETTVGAMDKTGLATSASEKVSANLWDLGGYYPGSTAYSAGSLADGSLHAATASRGNDVTQNGTYGSGAATISDRLTFHVSGAGANTVTPIPVTWLVDGSYSGAFDPWNGTPNAPSSVSASLGFYDLYGNGVAGISTCAYTPGNVPTFCPSGNSVGGWASSKFASDTPTLIKFIGILDLIGPSETLTINENLRAYAALGTTVDFSNTAQVGFVLPSDVSFTSNSGVFLTSASSVPEPAFWPLAAAGLLLIWCVRRFSRNPALPRD